VTGDTMLGCGQCEYCLAGRQHVCPNRFEVGIRDGWPGALAEKTLVPTRFAFAIPEHVSVPAAALVEPGGNSLRAVRAAGISPGHKVLVLGSGTIGLLAAQFALAEGAEVHVGGVRERSLELARSLGVQHTWQLTDLAESASDRFDAVIDATSTATMPALSVRLAKPAGRVVYIGLSSTPSPVDTREIALKDITAVGILSASPGLAGAIESFASGDVVPDSIVSEVIGLDEVAERLEGRRGPNAGPGPKVHVDPRKVG
jgi:threonine dehydrogenase-like Zn-dependent dehydrogenase